ncbi:flagellar biosynthesis protein FlhF [Rhodoferax koreense]|uniref:Flagellar biosynthesis protein FlhF n=1 Tax=Rhodoferax koreensis TaxID=1842727 RepID=A0A1P8JS94_9BURK|nr:flagellar biosynthesis protein FlhF [Rhodoferax koreense]APW36627.1 flagellar biosynthesis protein FlhF [Rhodoferax koreense]
MNIKRFHAATSREALAKARMAFGEGTLILSNRPTPTGVEVVATAEDSLSALDTSHEAMLASAQPKPQARPQPPALPRAEIRTPARPVAKAVPVEADPVEEDTTQLAMSTLSFQDYVRERMLRRRHEATNGQMDETQSGAPLFEARPAPAPAPVPAPRASHAAPFAAPAARPRAAPSAPAAAQAANKGIVDELQAMKEMIEERFSTMAWLGQAKQDPIQSNLMLKLIRAGYSPALARAVLERLPEELGAAEAVRWLMDVLERNLKTDVRAPSLFDQGGIYALVGATGVGKTTTAAKLAAHCVRVHGANSVGLITLDTYRVAAHEQLRAYGRMLGVVAHLAHDRAALQDLLGLLGNKKMVLIDTTGIAPRDPRKRDMLDVLDLPKVNRMLVLNAGGHGDTLDDVLTSFKTSGVQQAILSKVDEAVKLGPSLDAIIRHQLVLRGVCNGQRVPEDWEAADPKKLIGTSMRSSSKSAFDPKAADLSFFFSPSEPIEYKERAHA